MAIVAQMVKDRANILGTARRKMSVTTEAIAIGFLRSRSLRLLETRPGVWTLMANTGFMNHYELLTYCTHLHQGTTDWLQNTNRLYLLDLTKLRLVWSMLAPSLQSLMVQTRENSLELFSAEFDVLAGKLCFFSYLVLIRFKRGKQLDKVY